MEKISKKHWLAFLILFLFNVIILVFSPVIMSSLFAGITISILNVLLCLWLIHNYLKEPLVEYGLYFKKIHIQIISGILLVIFIDYLLLQSSINITSGIFYIERFVGKLISDPVNIFYFFIPLIYAIPEECVYRGFLLSFFQRLFNNPILSISLSAVLFGVSHYPSYHNIDQVVFASILGFIFGYLRVKDPEKFTLFSLSLAHFLHNTFMDNVFWGVM